MKNFLREGFRGIESLEREVHSEEEKKEGNESPEKKNASSTDA